MTTIMHLLPHPRSRITIHLNYSEQRGGIGEMSDNQGGQHGVGSANTAIQTDFNDALLDVSMIAILRGLSPDATTSLAFELRSLGVRFIEVTIQDEQGRQALRQTIQDWPTGPQRIGAGSIISTALARQAIGDGAEFLVSPGLSAEVVAAARDAHIPILAGVATPSEVQHAAALGLTAVKLFPAAQLGGPAYLRALAGPFPSIKFVPTGGVNFDNAQTYLAAGALAVGIGGELTQPSGLESLRRWIDSRSP